MFLLHVVYTLPAKEIRVLGKFQTDSFKTERLVFVETDGKTDMARSTRLVMLIKNIFTLWGGKSLLRFVANHLQGYARVYKGIQINLTK